MLCFALVRGYLVCECVCVYVRVCVYECVCVRVCECVYECGSVCGVSGYVGGFFLPFPPSLLYIPIQKSRVGRG